MNFKKRVVLIAFLGASIGGVGAREKSWPPEAGAKVPSNALAWPTTLEAVQQSLSSMLTQGATVLAVSDGQEGPVATVRFKKKVILCYVVPASADGVPTSRCWRLN